VRCPECGLVVHGRSDQVVVHATFGTRTG